MNVKKGEREEKSNKQQTKRPAPPLELTRAGGDEMNLVEYPFASLWGKEQPGAKIEHEWETQHPVTGRAVKAVWRVEGSTDLGLPGPSDERLYVALMELSREQGFAHQTVAFTRHDLVKRLKWPHNQHSYRMVLDGFRRLKAVSITSENAFWDASIKSFRNVGFGIIDNYDIAVERPGRRKKDETQNDLPFSNFRWNDTIFNSVQAGYIRALDVEFALSLNGDLALRLFRYLDKKSYDGRKSFEIELSVLCERHLGMKPTQYDSTRRARLKNAHEELLARGFLHSVAFAPMKTRRAEKACYAFNARRATPHEKHSLLHPSPESQAAPHAESIQPPSSTDRQNSENLDLRSSVEPASSRRRTQRAGLDPDEMSRDVNSEDQSLLDRILALKVSPDVARDLVQSASPEQLQLQLDCLEDREPRSRAATFIKAVREEWDAPGKYLERQEAVENARQAKRVQEAAKTARAEQSTARQKKQAVAQEEAARLDALWEELDAATREQVERQARHRLGVLGQAGRAPAALVAMRRNLMREQGLVKPVAEGDEPKDQ